MNPLSYHSNTLVSFSDTAIIYDQKQICDPVTFKVEQGERVIIDGKNGSGKSSLLKVLLNYPIEHTGKVETGSGVIISYVPQDTSDLEGTLTELYRCVFKNADGRADQRICPYDASG